MLSLAAACRMRLRDCLSRGRPVPQQLLEDCIEALGRVESRELVRERRDALIHLAADLLPPASPTSKARSLAALNAALSRAPVPSNWVAPESPTTPRDALRTAMLIADLPASARQYLRILELIGTSDTQCPVGVAATAPTLQAPETET